VALFGGRQFEVDPVAITDGRPYRDNNYDRWADAPIASV